MYKILMSDWLEEQDFLSAATHNYLLEVSKDAYVPVLNTDGMEIFYENTYNLFCSYPDIYKVKDKIAFSSSYNWWSKCIRSYFGSFNLTHHGLVLNYNNIMLVRNGFRGLDLKYNGDILAYTNKEISSGFLSLESCNSISVWRYGGKVYAGIDYIIYTSGYRYSDILCLFVFNEQTWILEDYACDTWGSKWESMDWVFNVPSTLQAKLALTGVYEHDFLGFFAHKLTQRGD